MKGRVGVRPGVAGKLLAAVAAMLCVGFLTSTAAAADTGRIAVTTITLDNRFHPVLELVDPIGGGAQLFAGSPGGPPALSWPTWNKDASAIAYYDSGQAPYGVWVKPLAGGPEHQLLPNADTAPSFSP